MGTFAHRKDLVYPLGMRGITVRVRPLGVGGGSHSPFFRSVDGLPFGFAGLIGYFKH